MSGVRVEIVHEDASSVADWLEAIGARADAMKPVMQQIAGDALFSTQRRFEREHGPDGRAWERLAASTLKRNRRRAKPAILRDTARLFQSLTAEADDDSAMVGTNVVYSSIHQFGGVVKRAATQRTAWFRAAKLGAGRTKDGLRVGSKLRFASASSRAKSLREKSFDVPAYSIGISARPYLGFDKDDERAIEEALLRHLTGEETQAGAPVDQSADVTVRAVVGDATDIAAVRAASREFRAAALRWRVSAASQGKLASGMGIGRLIGAVTYISPK